MKLFITSMLMTWLVLGLPSALSGQDFYQMGDKIDGEAAGDRAVGVSLSHDGKRLAIGAPQNDSYWGDLSFAGHVRVFEWENGWKQLGNDIDGEIIRGQFGSSLCLSSDGTRLAIGAYGVENNDGEIIGQVRVFEWNNGSWNQLGQDLNGPEERGYFGVTISLSTDGERLAVGAPGEDGGARDAGRVRIYQWADTAWVQLGTEIDGEREGDNSGSALSISGNGERLAVGAYVNEDSERLSGHVRVFEWSNGDWLQLGSDIDGQEEWGFLGYKVSLTEDGNRLAATARGTGAVYPGKVLVYDWINGAWEQQGSTIQGKEDGENFGTFLSISSDGQRLAIGAPLNMKNGFSAGQARIYDWNGGEWEQRGNDITGEAERDKFGIWGCISGDGKTLAVGALKENIGNPGQVRVFSQDSIPILVPRADSLRIFPNPTQQFLTIDLPSEVENPYQITLWDLKGRIVLFETIDEIHESVQLSLESLNQGLYLLQVVDKRGEITTKKILKE